MRNFDLKPTHADPCLYISTTRLLCVLVYVDDIIIAIRREDMEAFKAALGDELPITHSHIHWFLSNKITYDLNTGVLQVSQAALAQRIIAQAKMENCNPAPTPIVERLCTVAEPPSQDEATAMAATPFREIVGGLLYLTNCSRPDLSFAVNQLCRHMSNPRAVHWSAAKRVLRYLKGTTNLGLEFRRTDPAEPWVGYADADYAGDTQTRQSTSGFCFMLASACFSWRCMKQRCVALSTAEAEIIALTEAAKQATWLMQLAHDTGADYQTITIFEDNQAAISLTGDTKFSQRTKHMAVRHFFIRDKIEDKTINVEYVPTADQLADFFTKPLTKATFLRLRDALGMRTCD
jgi:hypothetical protein